MAFPRLQQGIYRSDEFGERERFCGGCQRWFPHDSTAFYRHHGKPFGLQSQCIECIGAKAREHSRRKAQRQTRERQYARAAAAGRIAA